MGARFAKWRAVIEGSDTLPTAGACGERKALARYAAICQEQASCRSSSLKCSDGSHTIERCEK